MTTMYREAIAVKKAIYPRIEELFHEYLDNAVLRPMKADALYSEIEALLSFLGKIEQKIDDEDAIREDLRTMIEDSGKKIPEDLED